MVFLIGETKIHNEGLQDYFKHKGIENWRTDASSDVEGIIEIMGRGCYESWGDVGENKNISRVRKGNLKYIQNIIKSGHGSVLEHGWLNFKFCDVSRVFTGELVRHRAGALAQPAISEQSHRFYRPDELKFWMPEDLETISTTKGVLTMQQVEDAKSLILETVEFQEEQYKKLTDIFRLDDEDNGLDFDSKKRLTTIMRRITPEGKLTDIGWSCNIRALRHIIESRTGFHVEEEIRIVFDSVAKIVKERYPNLFNDYERDDETGGWSTPNRKV